jgi:hypothetical protein
MSVHRDWNCTLTFRRAFAIASCKTIHSKRLGATFEMKTIGFLAFLWLVLATLGLALSQYYDESGEQYQDDDNEEPRNIPFR